MSETQTRFKSEICEMLGIKYPIFQGGMAWVADGALAGAVSNAGGVGIIAAGSAPREVVAKEIDKARSITDKPFGVNIMLMSDNCDDVAELCIEKNVAVITTGAGSPAKYMEAWISAGIKVFPVVPSVALAKRMEKIGASGVIAEGMESGGHIGSLTTMALLPQIVDAVNIPVIAAGGIADGRGVAAAFMFGAEGVQCGTCFLVADECNIHENYKEAVLKAGDRATEVTGLSHGHPIRAIKNKLTKKYIELENAGTPFEELEHMTLGSLRKAVLDGDKDEGTFMAGQCAAMVNSRGSCREIIENLFETAETAVNNFNKKYK